MCLNAFFAGNVCVGIMVRSGMSVKVKKKNKKIKKAVPVTGREGP
jgi:hypothetical protein